jgi:hypothetical protein
MTGSLQSLLLLLLLLMWWCLIFCRWVSLLGCLALSLLEMMRVVSAVFVCVFML